MSIEKPPCALLSSTEAIYTITEAYAAVHYGEVPETDAELLEIRACWESLKKLLRTSGV